MLTMRMPRLHIGWHRLNALLRILLLSALLVISPLARADVAILALFDQKEFKCLVKNIYYEARGEPVLGQEAVALVTINRARSEKFTTSKICDTVYAKRQFSWTDNKMLKVTDSNAWKRAEEVAYRVLSGNSSLENFNATHFHATYVNPGWGKPRKAKIGRHIFY